MAGGPHRGLKYDRFLFERGCSYSLVRKIVYVVIGLFVVVIALDVILGLNGAITNTLPGQNAGQHSTSKTQGPP